MTLEISTKFVMIAFCALIGSAVLLYIYQCWLFDRRCSKLPEATPYQERCVRVPKYKVRNFNKVMEKFKQRQNDTTGTRLS